MLYTKATVSIAVGVGTSENADAFSAGKQAARAACDKAKESFLDLLLVFASVRFEQNKLLEGIKSICPEATIVGCSSAGEISTAGSAKNSVVIMGLKSKLLSFSTGLGCGLSQNARLAGQKCARETIKARILKRHLFIMFADGLSGNTSDVIRGAQEVLGTSFPIVGGCAGDDHLFKKTYQYYRDRVFNDSVVGILLGGNISVGTGIRHGWCTIGKAHKVNKASGNIIQEIDGKAAFNLYQDYFGKEAEELKKRPWAKIATIYPLGMSIPDEDEYLIRYAYKATDRDELVCAAEVPQDSEVRLMMADKAGVLNAAREAALKAKEALTGTRILAAIIFDSVARKRVLGRAALDEIRVIKKTLGVDIPIIGFYSYGEQAPLKAQRYIGKSYFHNETVLVACLAEANSKR